MCCRRRTPPCSGGRSRIGRHRLVDPEAASPDVAFVSPGSSPFVTNPRYKIRLLPPPAAVPSRRWGKSRHRWIDPRPLITNLAFSWSENSSSAAGVKVIKRMECKHGV